MKAWTCIALFAATSLALFPRLRADETEADAPNATTEAIEKTSGEAETPPEPAKPALPLSLHCGQLVAIAPATAAEAVDMRKMISEGTLEPNPDSMPETAPRSPAQGSIFAIAEVRLDAKRTVGKTDFVLRHGDSRSKCMALASGQGAFDERIWEASKGTVRLLVEIPEETNSVALAYAQPLSVQLPDPPFLPFGEQPAAPVPETAESPTEDTRPPPKAEQPAKAIAKPAPTSKPEPKAAAKPKPKPTPKPKPKPKPKKPADAGIPLF